MSQQPSAEHLVRILIKYRVDESDPERGYVKFAENDKVAVLVNNFGGMSNLENGALMNEFLEHLPSRMLPVRVYTSCFETSLNAPAFALTLCNLTATATRAGLEVYELLEYLDAKTDSAWEAVSGCQTIRRPRKSQVVESPLIQAPRLPDIENLRGKSPKEPKLIPINDFSGSKTLEIAIRIACARVIEAEPI